MSRAVSCAIVILVEWRRQWFTIDYPDPFMLKVCPIRPEKRAEVPAVTHVDGAGRLQAGSERANPRCWRLGSAFARRTVVPMFLDTSLNESGPFVDTPAETGDCFLRARMERLVMGGLALARPAHGEE